MNSENPRDPFADFINRSLDMEGVEGLDPAAVAARVGAILKSLPTHMDTDLWNEQLDGLQAVIRVCLDLGTVLGAFEEKVDPTNFTREDLEILVMLSVTFGFVSYNRLKPAYSADQAAGSDNTLLATLGWVKRAAREGDPVAGKLVGEIDALLGVSKDLE